jgi:hypothetical protein
MTPGLRLAPEARAELYDAVYWYDTRRRRALALASWLSSTWLRPDSGHADAA